MDYTTMAADVLHFLQTHSLKDVSLMGHSMSVYLLLYLLLALPLNSDRTLKGWEGSHDSRSD
jgi:pimeloyl-ACP methyl ester carboxylesterase